MFARLAWNLTILFSGAAAAAVILAAASMRGGALAACNAGWPAGIAAAALRCAVAAGFGRALTLLLAAAATAACATLLSMRERRRLAEAKRAVLAQRVRSAGTTSDRAPGRDEPQRARRGRGRGMTLRGTRRGTWDEARVGIAHDLRDVVHSRA